MQASHITAAEVAPEDIMFGTYGKPDQERKTSNILSSTITDNIHHWAMSQMMSALTLARMATTRSHEPFTGFGIKGKGPALPPYVPGSGGGPSGSGSGGLLCGGPPGGGGGGLPGGGGAFPAVAPGAPAGGGGKLGGNPPRVFDGTCDELTYYS